MSREGPHRHQFRQSKWIISTSPPPSFHRFPSGIFSPFSMVVGSGKAVWWSESELIVPFCYIEGCHNIWKREKLLSLENIFLWPCEDVTFAYTLPLSSITGGETCILWQTIAVSHWWCFCNAQFGWTDLTLCWPAPLNNCVLLCSVTIDAAGAIGRDLLFLTELIVHGAIGSL